MPHRPNRSYVSNSDAFREMTPIARELLDAASASGEGRIPADAFATELQARAEISMDGLPASAWVGKVLDRVARDAKARGEAPLTSLVVLRTPAATRSTEKRPPVRRPAPAPEAKASEVTCPSCWMIVPAAATCRSCGEPLPAPAG